MEHSFRVKAMALQANTLRVAALVDRRHYLDHSFLVKAGASAALRALQHSVRVKAMALKANTLRAAALGDWRHYLNHSFLIKAGASAALRGAIFSRQGNGFTGQYLSGCRPCRSAALPGPLFPSQGRCMHRRHYVEHSFRVKAMSLQANMFRAAALVDRRHYLDHSFLIKAGASAALHQNLLACSIP